MTCKTKSPAPWVKRKMSRLYIDLKKLKSGRYNGLAFAVGLLIAVAILFFALSHNPYKTIHEQIFQTADNIRKYYSDRPGYWKLSTESAKEDLLIAGNLSAHKEFELKIGIGTRGEMAMPSDVGFDIALNNLNKSSCISLTEAKISKNRQLGLQKITVINSKATTEFVWGDEKHPLPISKYAARNVCQPTSNTVLWTFN